MSLSKYLALRQKSTNINVLPYYFQSDFDMSAGARLFKCYTSKAFGSLQVKGSLIG